MSEYTEWYRQYRKVRLADDFLRYLMNLGIPKEKAKKIMQEYGWMMIPRLMDEGTHG